MEIKKSAKASLENKRLLFTEIGLVIALLIVFLGFNWSSKDAKVAALEDTTKVVVEEEMIAIQNELPPPPPAAPALPELSDIVDIVDDNIEVDVDFVDLTEENGQDLTIQPYLNVDVPEEEDEDEVVPMVVVETKPTFNGRDANEFTRWVNSRLVYPEIARELGLQGRVTLQFTIGTDGRVGDVRVVKGVDPVLDQEALRVVSSSPRWTPGKQRDRAVKVSFIFPVVFRLK